LSTKTEQENQMSGKVTVIVHFTALPGMESRLDRVLRYLQRESLQETGCLAFSYLRRVDAAAQYLFIEEWDNDAHFQEHLISRHVRESDAELQELLSERQQVMAYRSAES